MNSLRNSTLAIMIYEWLAASRKVSYSSFGEDLVLEGILMRYKFITGESLKLSYIDIGGWKPKTGSNTFKLYKRGARGTIVEPNPYLRSLWNKFRPKDLFLAVGCSNNKFEKLRLFETLSPSNTIDEKFSLAVSESQDIEISQVIEIECKTLNEVVDIHKRMFNSDFILDLDIEGKDWEVLSQYDLNASSRPTIILVEDTNGNQSRDSDIMTYLKSAEYLLAGRTIITSIYIDLKHPISVIKDYLS